MQDPYEQQDDLALPSPDSVLPECPGDLEALLGQEGAWRGADAAPRGALLAVGSGLRPDGASRGQGPAGLAELDLIDGLDDELEQHVLHQPSDPVGSASPPAPQVTHPCLAVGKGSRRVPGQAMAGLKCSNVWGMQAFAAAASLSWSAWHFSRSPSSRLALSLPLHAAGAAVGAGPLRWS